MFFLFFAAMWVKSESEVTNLRYDRIIKSAKNYFDEKNYVAAKEDYLKALEIKPENSSLINPKISEIDRLIREEKRLQEEENKRLIEEKNRQAKEREKAQRKKERPEKLKRAAYVIAGIVLVGVVIYGAIKGKGKTEQQ